MLALFVALSLTAADAEVAEPETPPRSWDVPLSARLGLVLPGEISPYGVLLTKSGPAPIFLLEGGIEWKWFSVQAELQLAPLSGPPTLFDENRGTSSYTVFSLGVTPSFRWPVADWVVLRIGPTFGLNAIFGSATFTGTDVCRGESSCKVDSTGFGINFAPNLQAAFRLSGHWWLNAQASFFSQLLGFASTSDGHNRAYGIAPIVFFAVGPEYRL
ncbi:MAG: hypothetical protein QM723_05195 [Myxococcaceae bacterium]